MLCSPYAQGCKNGLRKSEAGRALWCSGNGKGLFLVEHRLLEGCSYGQQGGTTPFPVPGRHSCLPGPAWGIIGLSLSLLKHSCFLLVPRPADFSPLLPSEVFTAWPKCDCLKQKVENFGCFGASISPSAFPSASSASWSSSLGFFPAWFRARVSSLLVLCPLFPCCKYIALHQNEINFKNCGA